MLGDFDKRVLFITYTMSNPFAIGVFFRALRLSFELHRRGWTSYICNHGSIPEDPKVELARQTCRIFSIDAYFPAEYFTKALAAFQEIAPHVVVVGETPLPFMTPLYNAVLTLRAPLVLLEQYYGEDFESGRYGVDMCLRYGLHALWKQRPHNRRGVYKVVPPFIEEVTPKEKLAAAGKLAHLRWLTIIGFDQRVLEGGIALASALNDPSVLTITVSHRPDEADRLMAEAGIAASRRLALPLQRDEDLFGFMAASRVVVVANGFMHIMEGLALGCPVICIHRGIGMDGWCLNDTFKPFVSMSDEDPLPDQLRKLRGWMESCPFTPEEMDALRQERSGLQRSADEIENAAAHPRLRTRLERMTTRLHRVATRLQAAK